MNNNASATKKGKTQKRYEYMHIVLSVCMNEPAQKCTVLYLYRILGCHEANLIVARLKLFLNLLNGVK